TLGALRATLAKIVADTTYIADPSGQAIAPELVKLGWTAADAASVQRFFANTDTYAVSLDAAEVPDGLPTDTRLSYHTMAGELRCVGTLTAAENTALTVGIAGAGAAYLAAVAELADRPRSFAKESLQRVAPPTYSVALTALPSDLVIP